MNKDIILMLAIILCLAVVLNTKKLFSNNDKRMISIILVAYVLYLLLHQIPNFEYYSVNYDTDNNKKMK